MPNKKTNKDVKEKITDEELNKIKTLRNNSVSLMTAAENAYSKAKMAELEIQNYILKIFNKYSLSLQNNDNILDDGTMVRNKGKTNE